MIYQYRCYKCNKDFDVVKSHVYCSQPEECPDCKSIGERVYTPPQIDTTVCHEEYEYNHGLGCIVKGRNERKQVAKQMGLEEIGNEKINQDKVDSERKAKLEARWED